MCKNLDLANKIIFINPIYVATCLDLFFCKNLRTKYEEAQGKLNECTNHVKTVKSQLHHKLSNARKGEKVC